MSPARRWVLFSAQIALGTIYIAVFVFFLFDSRDFIADRINQGTKLNCQRGSLDADGYLQPGSPAGRVCLGSGWHSPEPGGVWSRHRHAWLYLPAPAQGVPATSIWMELQPYLHRDSDQLTVDLTINGASPSRLQLGREQASSRVEIPITAPLKIGEPIELRFEVHGAGSPFRSSRSSDTRTLGVFLRRAGLGRSQPGTKDEQP